MISKGKASPNDIGLVEDFPGLYPQKDTGVLAWLIVKEAQKTNHWPSMITMSGLKKLIDDNMDLVPIGFNYGQDALKELVIFGHIDAIDKTIELNDGFVDRLVSKFPA